MNNDSANKALLKKTIFFLFTFFAVILLILLLKIAHIQVVQEKYYTKFSQGQSEQRVILHAVRGQIFDRNNQVIVDNRPSYSLHITPAYFPQKERERKVLVEYLSTKLGISNKEFIDKITIKNKERQNKYIPILIKRDLSKELYTELKENEDKLQGVSIDLVAVRRYLLEDNLSHILGYTGIIDKNTWLASQKKYKQNQSENPYREQNSIIGKLGLERYKDKTLRGKDGLAIRLVTSKGQPIPDSMQIITKPKAGYNLYLTISKKLQEEAKKLMKNKRGAIIVSKPHTGEILAMVSNPSFNPNDIISRETSKIQKINLHKSKLFFNRAMRGTYPPSSIFKLIVAITALEEEKVNKKKKVRCTGAFYLGNRIFKCHKTHGKVNLAQAIEKSCNYYFYNLALELGWETIYKYTRLFNLGTPHDLEFGSSIGGIAPNEEWKKKLFSESWYPGDTLNHSIGQGYIILPPIQVHNIINIIATGGYLYKPYIIQAVEHPLTKEKVNSKPELIKKVKLKEGTLLFIKDALRGVVERGTGYYGRFSRKYPISGKTGTAQNPHGYDHAWFTALANDEEGNAVTVTIIIEDADNHGGGFTSAPIATALVRNYFGDIPVTVTQKEMGRLLYTESEIETSPLLTHNTDNVPYKGFLIDTEDPSSFIKYEDKILEDINNKNIAMRNLIEDNGDIELINSTISILDKEIDDGTKEAASQDIINKNLLQDIKSETSKKEKQSNIIKQKQKLIQKRKKILIEKQEKELTKKEQLSIYKKEKEKELQEKEIKRKIEQKRKEDKKPNKEQATPENVELSRLKQMIKKETKQFDKDKFELDLLE